MGARDEGVEEYSVAPVCDVAISEDEPGYKSEVSDRMLEPHNEHS